MSTLQVLITTVLYYNLSACSLMKLSKYNYNSKNNLELFQFEHQLTQIKNIKYQTVRTDAISKIKIVETWFNQFYGTKTALIVNYHAIDRSIDRKISYDYELYNWKALLQFYTAWIRRIESGQNKWSDDSVDIETPLLASSVRPKQNKLNRGASNMTKSPIVWFCSDFQKKRCSFSGSHDKVVKVVTRHLKHICVS